MKQLVKSSASQSLTAGKAFTQALVQGSREEIHRNGISVSRANKEAPEALRAFLGRELVTLSRNVKVNNTFSNEEDVVTAIEDIIQEFPSLKLEEVREVFTQIRRGKVELYGRLDTPTICNALRDYDVNVACEFREKHYKEALREEPLGSVRSFREIIDSLPEARPTFEEIMKRRSKLTPQQRAEIQERDKQRNGNSTGETSGET